MWFIEGLGWVLKGVVEVLGGALWNWPSFGGGGGSSSSSNKNQDPPTPAPTSPPINTQNPDYAQAKAELDGKPEEKKGSTLKTALATGYGLVYGAVMGVVDLCTLPYHFADKAADKVKEKLGGGILGGIAAFCTRVVGAAASVLWTAALVFTPVGNVGLIAGAATGAAVGASTFNKAAREGKDFTFTTPKTGNYEGENYIVKPLINLGGAIKKLGSRFISLFKSKPEPPAVNPQQNVAQNTSQTQPQTKGAKSHSPSQKPTTPLVANSASKQATNTALPQADSTVKISQPNNSSGSSRSKVQSAQNLGASQALLTMPTIPPPGLSYPCSKPSQIKQTLAAFLSPTADTSATPIVSPSSAHWSTPVTQRLTTFSSPDADNKAAAAWVTQAANKDKNSTGLNATLYIKTEKGELDRLIIAKKLIDDLCATLNSTPGNRPGPNEPLVITISSSKIPAMDKAIIDYCAMMKKPPLVCEIEKNGVAQEQKSSYSPKDLAALKTQLETKVGQIDSSYKAEQKDTADKDHSFIPH